MIDKLSNPSTVPTSVDVVVIGGGPAGATSSTLLAKDGKSVALFERDHFPRYHIGESLIPETFFVFERLGLLPKMRSSHFVQKLGVQFINQRGKLSEPFFFTEHKPHPSSQTWQVRRSEFDEMLLNHARENGVQAFEGARVMDVLFEGDRAVGVRVKLEDGKEHEVRASVVVDASGQSSMLMDRFGLRQWDPDLKKAALWTYWKGAFRDVGPNQGSQVILQLKDKVGWFWYIPLADDIISVGVVAGVDYLFKNREISADRSDTEAYWGEIYHQEVARCPGLQPRIENAERCDVYRVQKEYSYRSKQAAGNGWVLCGDAYGFLDPLYSSGVMLALTAGSKVADAISDGLAKGDTSGAQLGRWQADFNRGMDRTRRLVCAYYDGFSFGRFVSQHPDLKGILTDLLIGDIWDDRVDVVWEPLNKMRAEMGLPPLVGMLD